MKKKPRVQDFFLMLLIVLSVTNSSYADKALAEAKKLQTAEKLLQV